MPKIRNVRPTSLFAERNLDNADLWSIETIRSSFKTINFGELSVRFVYFSFLIYLCTSDRCFKTLILCVLFMAQSHYWLKGNMKTPTRNTATRIIPTGQFLPGKLPRTKIPTQDNSHPDNSHPGQFPLGKFLPRKIPAQIISTPDNCNPPNLTKFNNI